MPDGKVGHDAFAVIRETIRTMDKVAIGRVVLTNREHIIALEPLDKGLMGTLLRYPYEVRSEKEYFDDIQDVKITKDMLDLAKHIVEQKSGSFEPETVRGPLRAGADRPDQPEAQRPEHPGQGRAEEHRQRHQPDGRAQAQPCQRKAARPCRQGPRKAQEKSKGKKPRKAAAGQREMLLPISGSGKRAAKETAKEAPKKAEKPVRAAARTKKAG